MPATGRSDRERPFGLLLLGAVAVVLLIAVGGWLLLPDGPVTIAALAVLVLGALFLGVWGLLSLPQFSREPEGPSPPPESD